MSTVTAVIPVFYPERRQNLPVVVEALRAGTRVPDEIIVWNNGAPVDPIDGVSVVQSHRNVGCQGRFYAALMATTDLVLFTHDDLLVGRDTLDDLVRWYATKPAAVWAMHGRIAIEGPYEFWQSLKAMDDSMPRRLDVALGRCDLLSAVVLRRILSRYHWPPTVEMDDLWFSASARLQGIELFLPPMPESAQFRKLSSQGVGYCHQPDWYQQRDDYARRIIPDALGAWPWRAGQLVTA